MNSRNQYLLRMYSYSEDYLGYVNRDISWNMKNYYGGGVGSSAAGERLKELENEKQDAMRELGNEKKILASKYWPPILVEGAWALGIPFFLIGFILEIVGGVIVAEKPGEQQIGVPNLSLAIPPVKVVQTLNTYFTMVWICKGIELLCFLPLHFLESADMEESFVGNTEQMAFLMFLFLFAIFYVIGIVFECLLVYQLWKRIPRNIGQTTPGNAVCLSFIPIFNLYWMFVAYKGLGEDMNMTLQQRGISYQVNEGLGLAHCILFLTYWPVYFIVSYFVGIPLILEGLGFLISIAILIFFLKSVKDGAIALLNQGEMSP